MTNRRLFGQKPTNPIVIKFLYVLRGHAGKGQAMTEEVALEPETDLELLQFPYHPRPSSYWGWKLL